MTKRSNDGLTPAARRLTAMAWIFGGLCGYNIWQGDRIWTIQTAVGAVICAIAAFVLHRRTPRA